MYFVFFNIFYFDIIIDEVFMYYLVGMLRLIMTFDMNKTSYIKNN